MFLFYVFTFFSSDVIELKCNFCDHLINAAFISIPKVPETFHARFSVRSSLYRYYSIAG